MAGLVLGGAFRPAAAGPVDGAGAGEDLVEVGGAGGGAGGSGGEGGGQGVGGAAPRHREGGGGEGRGEVGDGVDVEREAAVEAAVGAELGGEGLDRVEIRPERLLLYGLRIGIFRVRVLDRGAVGFGGGEGAGGGRFLLGVEGEGFA